MQDRCVTIDAVVVGAGIESGLYSWAGKIANL